MAIYSPLRSRRSLTRQNEITQQLIAFLLRREWFALPIESVLKVVPMSEIYGNSKQTGVSLTIYQGSELLVVDVGQRIFGEAPSSDLAIKSASVSQEERYLLIVQDSNTEVFGLPIDSPPAIRRVPESSFAPMPAAYVAQGNIQCVSSLMIVATEQPPLFLLDPERLLSTPFRRLN